MGLQLRLLPLPQRQRGPQPGRGHQLHATQAPNRAAGAGAPRPLPHSTTLPPVSPPNPPPPPHPPLTAVWSMEYCGADMRCRTVRRCELRIAAASIPGV